MSIRVDIKLHPGGDPSRAEPVGTIDIWRQHPEPRPESRYAFRATTATGTRLGDGVLHERRRDVLDLLRAVLNHSEGTPGYCPTCHRQGPTLPGTAQETLFEPAPALSDPAANAVTVMRQVPRTSAAAALQALPRSGTQRERILTFLAQHGPQTDDVIQAVLDLPANTERPRRRELVQGGWVEDSGETAPMGLTGNQAIVWRLTAEGRRRWEAGGYA